MESHPYTKPRGVGPVTTQLTTGAEPASWKSAAAPDPWPCSPTCRAWSESSTPFFTDSTSTGAGCTCSPCNNSWATPSAFLHQQLDVTTSRTSTSSFRYELGCNSCYLLFGDTGTGAGRVRLRAAAGPRTRRDG